MKKSTIRYIIYFLILLCTSVFYRYGSFYGISLIIIILFLLGIYFYFYGKKNIENEKIYIQKNQNQNADFKEEAFFTDIREFDFMLVDFKEEVFFTAIREFDFILVEKLLNSGIDINLQNNNGDTLLMVAVMINVTTKEIDKKSSKKSKSVKYNRVNNLDLIKKQERVIRLLLEKNADVYIKNKYDDDILHIIKEGSDYSRILKIFNEYGYFKEENFTDINIDKEIVPPLKEEPFIESIKNTDKNKLIELMNNNFEEINELKYYGMTLLYYAVIFDNVEMVKFLLDKGANLKAKNNKLKYDYEIERASYYTKNITFRMDEVPENKVLEEYKDYTDNHGDKSPLDLAKKNNHHDILEIFLEIEFHENINKLIDGVSPLYKAIIDNDIELVQKLLKSGADIHLKNSDSVSLVYDMFGEEWYKREAKTPLYGAVNNNNLDILKLMPLPHNIADLLNYAIQEEKTETALYLIQKSKDLNEKIPLKTACQSQNFKIIKSLIEYDADVNGVDEYGQTALFDAIEVKKANIDIIQFLLENGADVNQEDNKGITPLSFAQSNKKSLVKVLTASQEKQVTKKSILDKTIEYQALSKKITSQNRVINDLKKEIESLKENANQNDFINELNTHIEIQSKKIYSLENERLSKEIETQKIISELLIKIETLEKNILKKSKVKKSSSIPKDIKIENQSLKKDDGIIVKRESFDDF